MSIKHMINNKMYVSVDLKHVRNMVLATLLKNVNYDPKFLPLQQIEY